MAKILSGKEVQLVAVLRILRDEQGSGSVFNLYKGLQKDPLALLNVLTHRVKIRSIVNGSG